MAMVITGMASPCLALAVNSSSTTNRQTRHLQEVEATEDASRKKNKWAALNKKLPIFGSFEIETSYYDTETASDEKNFTLAAARLGLQLDISDNIGDNLVFLHENGEQESEVEEVNISLTWDQIGGGNLKMVGGIHVCLSGATTVFSSAIR